MVTVPALTITKSIEIAAPVERVWRALTDPGELLRWHARKAEVDLRVGGRLYFDYGFEVETRGTIAALDPPRLLRFDDAFDGTTVTYTLEPANGGTRLVLLVEGFRDDEESQEWKESATVGWQQTLDNLRSVLERGEDLRPTFWRVRMGVSGIAVPESRKAETGAESGAYLRRVVDGGPAARAGLRPADVVVAVDGASVRSYTELLDVILTHEPGDRLSVEYVRHSGRHTAMVTLEAREP